MLTKKEIAFLREELATAKNPLFFYDDDGDGLASFLLLYRLHREGKGVRVGIGSRITTDYLRKVEELNPDKIFILDTPTVDQEFIDKANRPIFWIDHHDPQDNKKVHYYNPRIRNPKAYIPTSYMAYQIAGQDLWIAATGCLADYQMPDFIKDFIKQFPKYLPRKTTLPKALYKYKVGVLAKLFFFLQKGSSNDIKKSTKILTKINHPDEIFEEQTPAGKFLHRRFQKINQMYENLLKEAKKSVTRSRLAVFYYSADRWSFTANVANELTVLYPKKVIIIARKKGGTVKASIRAQKPIKEALLQSLEGVDGRGGGHPNACGAVIKEEDWELFLQNFKTNIKNVF